MPYDDEIYGPTPNTGYVQPFSPPLNFYNNSPAAPNTPDKDKRGLAHWFYDRRHGDTPWFSLYQNENRQPVWQEQIESARGFTPSSASDFPETGSFLLDDRNWAWQNFFANIGNSALGTSAGYSAITPGGKNNAIEMLELQAEYDRQNAERNLMRRKDVSKSRYMLDLVTPAASIAVGTGLPGGAVARGFGSLAGGLSRVAPNVFRNSRASFVNTYFPQASGWMRGVQAAGERLPFIAGLNDVARSEPGKGFRTSVPWLLGGAGYGVGTVMARNILGRSARNILGGQTSGWGSLWAAKPANQVYGGTENLLNNRSNRELANAFYDATLNRFSPNILGGGGGSLGGFSLGGAGIDQIEQYENLMNSGVQ
jgi:hypothetical protein